MSKQKRHSNHFFKFDYLLGKPKRQMYDLNVMYLLNLVHSQT